MNIYTIKGIGRQHPLHTEDHLYYHLLDDRWCIFAVMDGCSSATESYFPSILYAKSLAASVKKLDRTGTFTTREIGEGLLKNLFNDLKSIMKTFHLNLDELLATMILSVLDLHKAEAGVWAAGDGYFICNGQVTEIDHRNTPDYPAYHLNKNFEEWLADHVTNYRFTSVADISLSTDGIGKIMKNPMISGLSVSPLEYLLLQPVALGGTQALQKKYEALINQHGYLAYDDVAAIRIIM